VVVSSAPSSSHNTVCGCRTSLSPSATHNRPPPFSVTTSLPSGCHQAEEIQEHRHALPLVARLHSTRAVHHHAPQRQPPPRQILRQNIVLRAAPRDGAAIGVYPAGVPCAPRIWELAPRHSTMQAECHPLWVN
jgi:hypothetical protein